MKLPFIILLCFWVNANAEPRALPPVIDHSTYPGGNNYSAKPSANNSIYETLGRLEELQNEVQQLRGKVEEQAFTILELKKRVNNIYSDIDQRLLRFENNEQSQIPSRQQPLQQREISDTVNAKPAEKMASKSPMPDKNEKRHYLQAYEALRNGHNNQAIQLFNQQLKEFPAGEYADNAQYWLGEAYKIIKDLNAAKQAFNKVIADHPNSAKVPDAKLKLGIIALEQNNPAEARDYFTDITISYPSSTAAHLASKKLLQLK